MMNIYTKTGDAGETGLFGGKRVSKTNKRIVAYGTIDELNSAIGFAVSCLQEHVGSGQTDLKNVAELLLQAQHDLFTIGSNLATPYDPADIPASIPLFSAERTVALERHIDRFQEQLPPLTTFILPGGSVLASALHVARTVCRRAERETVELLKSEMVMPEFLQYLNRLSDLLFVLARFANLKAGVADTPWRK